MISASSFKDFVNRVHAAKYPDRAGGVQSDIDPNVIQGHYKQVETFRSALNGRTESTVDDIKNAFRSRAKKAGYLEMGLAAVGIAGVAVAGAGLFGALGLGVAAFYGGMAVAGVAGLGARQASLARAENQRYEVQTEQFSQVYNDYQNGTGGEMAYMLVGDSSFNGGHTDGFLAIPMEKLRPENVAKLCLARESA